MVEPRVPGGDDEALELSCGQSVAVSDLDLGMREYACPCGERHAVVMDVHPPSRFFPEFMVEVLRETVETTDEAEEFGTLHLMGIAMEEFPEKVAHADVENDPDLGCSVVWMTEFAPRRLHEILVELVVELMEHAISHAEDDEAMAQFEEEMLSFDVATFVDEYRESRDLTRASDTPV